jgi:hypothetical protein
MDNFLGRQTMQPLSLPLVKPDVRHSHLRLTDDRPAIGIHNELRVMTEQSLAWRTNSVLLFPDLLHFHAGAH